MRYSGPYLSQLDADRQSRAAMVALCRQRGKPYPLPPDPHVVRGRPLADPSVAFATHGMEIREGNGGRFWARLTDEIESLPASTERVDGQEVPVARVGVTKPNSDFRGHNILTQDLPGRAAEIAR